MPLQNLKREIGLLQATSINMIDMIGIGLHCDAFGNKHDGQPFVFMGMGIRRRYRFNRRHDLG